MKKTKRYFLRVSFKDFIETFSSNKLWEIMIRAKNIYYNNLTVHKNKIKIHIFDNKKKIVKNNFYEQFFI